MLCQHLHDLEPFQAADYEAWRGRSHGWLQKETVILPQRTAYKIVLKKYLQVKKEYTSDGQMRIQLSQVKAALKIAGYSFDEDLMERLFSGSGIYTVSGQKSARLLRNGIEHEMNVNDLQEVHDRLASLFADMDSFITWIQL